MTPYYRRSPRTKAACRRRRGWRKESTKGNAEQQTTRRTQSRASVSHELSRVREAAKRDRTAKFTALFHHVTVDRLRSAYLALSPKAAAGVDGVNFEQYGERLAENLRALHRLHRGARPAKPSRRALHPAGRAAKTAGHRNARRQDRTESGGRGTECNLRGGFPRVFVRIPAPSERARSTGCAGGGNRTSESELCARCRHPRFLRNHRSRMDDEIHRARIARREDSEADAEVNSSADRREEADGAAAEGSAARRAFRVCLRTSTCTMSSTFGPSSGDGSMRAAT